MRWKIIFQRYQQNAMKNNFSPLPAERGEKKSPLKLQTLQTFTVEFKRLSQIHKNYELNKWQMAQWNNKKVSGSNPCTVVFLQEIRRIRWKKILPLKTANPTEIHRFHRIQR